MFYHITNASYELYRYTYDKYAKKSRLTQDRWNGVFIRACMRDSKSEDGIRILMHLKSEHNVDFKTKEEERNMTALHLACQSGHPRIVEYLIDECPELVMMRDSNNTLPLHMCSLRFTQYTFLNIEILLEDEALIQNMTEWDWYMNIRNAIESGVYELYEFWIDYLEFRVNSLLFVETREDARI